jgi:hypothetical protein
MPFLSKYGVARHIYIPIPKAGSANHAVGADWTPAAGDVKISKDGGAAANVTNLPTAIAMGNSALWDFSVTATEMEAAQVKVLIADSATKAVDDTGFEIETYGHASGQHAFDLDTSSVAQTGDNYARLGAPAGASVSADIAAIEAQTDDIGAAGAGLTAADDAILAILGAPAGASLSADVAAVKAQTAAIETDTAEIGAAGAGLTVLATQASVNTIDDFLDTEIAAILAAVDTEVAAILAAVDTEIAAIKAKTDSLTFTKALELDVNMQSINGTTVNGDGSATPWGP